MYLLRRFEKLERFGRHGFCCYGRYHLEYHLSLEPVQLVLVPLNLTFLRTISFVILIASFVQLLEIIIKKQSPTLYNMWGIYLMLIATNCIVLSVPVISVTSGYNFLENIIFAVGAGIGFAIALILMASCREKMDFADIPHAMKGTPIAFVLAGMMSLAFLGFSGMI